MCDNNSEKSKEYTETKSSFDDLGSNEKAAFLVESTIQMVVEGVRQAGDAVTDALKNVSAEFDKRGADGSGEDSESDESGDSPQSSSSKGGGGAAGSKTSSAKKKKKAPAKKKSDDDSKSTE